MAAPDSASTPHPGQSPEPEDWLPVPEYEGSYEVSSLGKVRSLPRFRKGHYGWPIKVRARVLKPYLKSMGYYTLHLYLPRQQFYVHRLVALVFIPNPDGLPEVNHRDGDKLNNRVSNLEWVSHIENSRHASRIGLLACGTGRRNSKLTEAVIPSIRERAARGETAVSIARDYGVQDDAIRCIIIGRTWRHVR